MSVVIAKKMCVWWPAMTKQIATLGPSKQEQRPNQTTTHEPVQSPRVSFISTSHRRRESSIDPCHLSHPYPHKWQQEGTRCPVAPERAIDTPCSPLTATRTLPLNHNNPHHSNAHPHHLKTRTPLHPPLFNNNTLPLLRQATTQRNTMIVLSRPLRRVPGGPQTRTSKVICKLPCLKSRMMIDCKD